MSAEYKYRAFISYSHKDEKWASWLHKALETFKVPKYLVGQETSMGTIPERMGKVFRDREELSSSHSLGSELTQALEDSACQIVICSPNAANSHWTNEEILTYKRLGRENRIFCLIVDGEPGTDQECFPPAIRFQMGVDGVLSDRPAEPIAADARQHADGKINSKLKLISGMLGVGFDALKQRELQRLKKRKAIITAAATAAFIVTSGLAYSVYLNITSGPEEVIDPVSVLIADFDNQTGDPQLDGSLEQALQIGLEVAPFITNYTRSTAQEVADEIQSQSSLDISVSRLVAVRENIGMVLAGSIAPDGSGYELSLQAIDPGEGTTIVDVDADARNKDQILSAIGALASELLEELGGDILEEDVVFASDSFTAASLDAVKSYTTAQELQHIGQDEQAVEFYARAVEQDPSFTRAFSGWALSLSYLGRTDESTVQWEKALANLDRVTERERLRTLGVYYSLVTRNYQKALESFQSLVDKYPADDIGHNNLAVLHFLTLGFDEAVNAGKNVLELYPNSTMYQSNFALFAMYASDFETAQAEARKALERQPDYYKAWLPIAIYTLATGDTDAALQAYENMAAANELAESEAALGVADTHIYAGEFSRARESLQSSLEKSIASGNQYGTATKHMALAYSHESEGDIDGAVASMTKALAVDDGEPWVVPAALTFLAAGDVESATAISGKLMQKLQPQSRAYGMLIDGLILQQAGQNIAAIEKLTAAIELADLWLVRFYLGKIYLEGGHSAEALDEFTICMERRGEAASLFLDDLPTYRYVAPLYYWLGVAQKELHMSAAATTSFQTFLDLRPNGGALTEDASRHLSD
ncbi:MAG: TIR domain-containing protein [Woeseiaceae bacterium]